ncbi:MAG TPA: four helix bundle protein [Methylomirabilota bacterium]|nr:four helix bundle protein [Methylomirabilota bacterium]
MNERIFKERTKQLALCVIELAEELPRNRATDVIARQVLRSATSIGANYRAACRGQSAADVIAKVSIVEEEADESVYWLELLTDCDIVPEARVTGLLKELDEIIAMTGASVKTLRARNNPKSKIQNPK